MKASKITLAFLVAFLYATKTWAACSIVQAKGGTSGFNTGIAISTTSGLGSGHELIFAYSGIKDGTLDPRLTSVSGCSATWSKIVGNSNGTSGTINTATEIWLGATPASGACTVTATANTNQVDAGAEVYELAGCTGTTDGTNSAAHNPGGSSSSMTTGAITPGAGDSVIMIAAFTCNTFGGGAISGMAGGFTADGPNSPNGSGLTDQGHQITTASGSYTGTETCSQDNFDTTAVAAFKASGAAASAKAQVIIGF